MDHLLMLNDEQAQLACFFFYWPPTAPLKFNIAPEKLPSQQESSFPTTIFQGRAVKLHVFNGLLVIWVVCIPGIPL